MPDPSPGASAQLAFDGRDDRRTLVLALVTIVLALVLLVSVPVLVQRRIDRIRTGLVEVADSAHREANELAYAVAREMALLRDFVVEGDPVLLRDYRELRQREAAAFQRLDELAPQLPPAVGQRLDHVRALSGRWHAAVDAELALRPAGAPGGPAAERVFARALHEQTLAAIAGLQESLVATKAQALQRVESAERHGLAATVVLALLALLATALVVWLGRRVRAYAERAEREHREAVRANEARARLMRGLAHDLKNPLGAVVLYAELLEMGTHGELTAEQTHIVERIRAAGRQVVELLGDLLDLSQAETGLLPLKPTTVALEPLLRETIEHHAAAAAAAGLSLRLELADALPPLQTDARRLRQILDNLIGNAIKYTPRGGAVTVRAERLAPRRPPGSPERVAIAVRDTGPGIPRDQLEHVFEEFVRLPGARHHPDGSGIGLAISRQLARLMGGEITVASEVGHGSTFTLSLPAPPFAAARSP